jgi:hypothetical protein
MYRTQKSERLKLAELTHWRAIYSQPLYPIGLSSGTSFLSNDQCLRLKQLTVNLKVCSSVEEAKRLEGQLIRQYNTVEKGWNLLYED